MTEGTTGTTRTTGTTPTTPGATTPSTARTTVEAVAADLRTRILAGDLAPGSRLRERVLVEQFGVARHTLRAALRALAADRLAVVEPHRGVRVAALDDGELRALFELRAALELEAARLLADRGALTALPERVLEAAAALDAVCAQSPADRGAVDQAHAALHHSLVVSSHSPRIIAAHAALEAESRLALVQSRGALPVGVMARDHRRLLSDLARTGPRALRRHLDAGRLAAGPVRDLRPQTSKR